MTSWSSRWTQMKYAKLQLWRTFNLNKTQSLNGALRAVCMEEEEGNFVAPGEGVRNQPELLYPHTYRLLKKQPIIKYFEITWAWPKIR